jgi:hypothetical protein
MPTTLHSPVAGILKAEWSVSRRTLGLEGFRVNHQKTRVMRRGVRQHLAGLVKNRKPNIRRSDFDRLKAALTNCVRFGPESQNRERRRTFVRIFREECRSPR